MSQYKFAFAPENSNDEGYVTEKVYDAFQAGERSLCWCVNALLPSMGGGLLHLHPPQVGGHVHSRPHPSTWQVPLAPALLPSCCPRFA